MEVTMAKLFRLTGLAAPQMGLADEDIASLPPGAWQVASRYDETFQDLGSFLASERAARLASGEDDGRQAAYTEQRARHDIAVAACNDILQRAGVQHFWELRRPDLVEEHAAQDRLRFDALEAMNRMLPATMRCEQLRHYIASSWLDNWDHLNYRMENFGYAERDGYSVGMTVDFGSCGPLGFRNMITGKMQPKSASSDIALLQRPPALFPIPDNVRENSQDFDVMSGYPGMLQDTLRWPYGFQSESIVEMIRPPIAPDPAVADTLSEMGYRLKLLSPGAIAAVVRCYWRKDAEASADDWPSADALIEVLHARCDALLEKFDDGELGAWARDNPDHASRIRRDMLAALQDVQIGGSPAAMAALEAALQARHDALLDPSAPVSPINGLTREIRSLQAFRNAVKELAAGRQDADDVRIDRAVTDLMSDRVYGQLMVNLHLGPGARPDTRPAFAANLEWLQLMTELVRQGMADAGTVANLLMTPYKADYYPPGVAINAKDHPGICSAFITLLDTLAHATPGVTSSDLRSRLLQAKNKGQPNFYSTLLASEADMEWSGRLARRDLLPNKDEVQTIKGRWSARAWRWPVVTAADALQDSAASVAQDTVSQTLTALLDHVEHSYRPRQLVRWEASEFRATALSVMRLTSGAELKSVDDMVATVAADAWRDALRRYPVLKGTPLPQDMTNELQAEACRTFSEHMAALRREQANRIISAGYDRYEECVLADPTLSAQDRTAILDACVEGVRIEILKLIEGEQTSGHAEGNVAAAGENVESLARIEEQVWMQAREQTSALAGKAAAQNASHQASVEAKREARLAAQRQVEQAASHSVTSVATERAQRDATQEAQRHAALRAYKESSEAARQRADEKVRKETRERIARDGDARTASIAARLKVLQDDRFDRQLEQRLAALKAPASPVAARAASRVKATRAAECLDKSGKPRVVHR